MYSAKLSRNNLASKALRYDTCYTRVHTVLAATKHEQYLPLLTSHKASPLFGRYSLRLPTEGWPGWVDLGVWLDRDFSHLQFNADTVTHPSTNRARRRVTLLRSRGGSTLGQRGNYPTNLGLAPKCDMKDFDEFKALACGCQRRVTLPSKYTRMRFPAGALPQTPLGSLRRLQDTI